MTGCHGPEKANKSTWPRLAAAGHDSNLTKVDLSTGPTRRSGAEPARRGIPGFQPAADMIDVKKSNLQKSQHILVGLVDRLGCWAARLDEARTDQPRRMSKVCTVGSTE